MTIVPQLVRPVEALLGEGPAWFHEAGILRFVDIKRGHLHSHHPATDVWAMHDLGGQPSFVVPSDEGGLVVGSGNHIIYLSKAGDEPRVLAEVPMPRHNRTNDATVDRQGRLWFGTMDDNESQPTGALWCFDRGHLHRLGGDAVVTNGPAISADGCTLYHVDSGERRIWRFTLGTGADSVPKIEREELFLQLTEADGYPDGIVLDCEGCLWVALWDGWGVRRYAPDGTRLSHIAFPCARVTKLAFGGPELRTAYVTTARVGLDDAARAAQPLAGGLFTFTPPVAGLPLPSVKLR